MVTNKQGLSFSKTGNDGSAEWTVEQDVTIEAPSGGNLGNLADYKRTFFDASVWVYQNQNETVAITTVRNLYDKVIDSMPSDGKMHVYRRHSPNGSITPDSPKPRVYTLTANVGALPLTWLDAGTLRSSAYNVTPDRNLTGCSKSDLYAYDNAKAQTVKTKIAGVDYAAISASVDTTNKKGYVNGKTDLKYTFTYTDFYAATALPTASQGCHSFGGWKNGSDTVSNYSYYKTAIEGDPYNAKSFSVTGSWGAHAPAAANIKAETIYETCTHHGLNYSYCTICGNLLTVGTRNRLSTTGQHNYVQHKHFVKDASGAIQTVATVGANAPVNANFKISGTRDTQGYEDDFVATKFGGAGTCYTEQGTNSHTHTQNCRTDTTIATGSNSITTALGREMTTGKYMTYAFNVPKSSGSSSGMYCPECGSDVTGPYGYYHCSNYECKNYSKNINPLICADGRDLEQAKERYGENLLVFLNDKAWEYIKTTGFDADIQNSIIFNSTATIECPYCHNSSALNDPNATITRTSRETLRVNGNVVAEMTMYRCENVIDATRHQVCGKTFDLLTEGNLYSYKMNYGERKWTCGVCGAENDLPSSGGGSPTDQRCKVCSYDAQSWVCRACLKVNGKNTNRCGSCNASKDSSSSGNMARGTVSWSIYGTKCNLKQGTNTGYYITCDQRRVMMCNNDGHDFYTCTFCGDKKDQGYVPKTGHAFNNWTKDTPSCYFTTYTHRECQREVAHQRSGKGHTEQKDAVAAYNHGGVSYPSSNNNNNGWWRVTGTGSGNCLSGIPVYWKCDYCQSTYTTYNYDHTWHTHTAKCYEYLANADPSANELGNIGNDCQPKGSKGEDGIKAALKLFKVDGKTLDKYTINGYGGEDWGYALDGDYLYDKDDPDQLTKTLNDDAKYQDEDVAALRGVDLKDLGWSDNFYNGIVDENYTVIQNWKSENVTNGKKITYLATRIGHLKSTLWQEWDDNNKGTGTVKHADGKNNHPYSGHRYVHRGTYKVTVNVKYSRDGLDSDKCPAYWRCDTDAQSRLGVTVCEVCGEKK